MKITKLVFLAPEKIVNNAQIQETQTMVDKSYSHLPLQSGPTSNPITKLSQDDFNV